MWQGHSTGITASRNPEIYSWMLSIARGRAGEVGTAAAEEEEEEDEEDDGDEDEEAR